MVEIKGLVTSTNQKEGKYGFTIGPGNWYNGYGVCPCKKGDEIECIYEQNGTFKNVTSVKVLNAGTESKGPTDANKYNMQMSKLKNKTNARICALECAVTLVDKDSANRKDEVIILADELVKFIEDESF